VADELTYKAIFSDGPLAGDYQRIPRVGTMGNEIVPELEVRDPFGGGTIKYKHNGETQSEYFPFHIPPYMIVEATYSYDENEDDKDFYYAPPEENF
jgi:hypothetical protein